jgi:CotS family spore coat protein
MNEKSLVVLDNYDIEPKNLKRVRGVYYIETGTGMFLLNEYTNSKGRLELLEKMQQYIEDKGHQTDLVVRNKNDELMTQGPDGGFYILKKWFAHKECEADKIDDLVKVTVEMAKIHADTERMEGVIAEETIFQKGNNLVNLMRKHSRELQLTARYIDRAKNKREFEYQLKEGINRYYEQALRAEQYLAGTSYLKLLDKAYEKKSLCHGNVRHHNALIIKDYAVIINYIKAACDLQIVDFYKFFKKVMEKNNWNISFAKQLVEAYDKNRFVSDEEWKVFAALLLYPERFWKVANNYLNSGKAWLSEKNKEKLRMFLAQETGRGRVVEEFASLFR